MLRLWNCTGYLQRQNVWRFVTHVALSRMSTPREETLPYVWSDCANIDALLSFRDSLASLKHAQLFVAILLVYYVGQRDGKHFMHGIVLKWMMPNC